MEFMLTDNQKNLLLKIARESIEHFLTTGKKVKPEIPEADILKNELAVFVTLKLAGNLRGCIGHMEAREPLYLAVSNMAYAAAFEDPRFTPVTAAELDSIVIEISVLTPMQKIEDYRKIRLGIDGVLVKKGWKSGVFLPQVAEETGWDLDTFLQYLCAHKAHLPADAYQKPDIDIFIFQVIKFSEKSN
jgi:AmmeMemoRadiSam system protein A